MAIFLTAFLGLFVGSFANVVILRLHSGQKGIMSGRSECFKCKHTLHPLDLLPVVSWLSLRGKCRYCHAKISWQYPLVEICMGLVWLLAAVMIPVGTASTWQEWAHFGFVLCILSSLVIITVYDLKYLEIPDEVSLPTICILLLSLPFSFTPSWSDALIGAGMAFGFFALQILISRGKWMGGGDLRMAIIMGLLLGWKATLLALFLSYFFGAGIGLGLISLGEKKLSSEMPFGPFLALGTVLTLFWGQEIVTTYEQLMRLII